MENAFGHFTVYTLLMAIALAQDNETPAYDKVPLAVIDTVIKNDSVLIGQNADFYCEIVGNQEPHESLVFSKIAPDQFLISVDYNVEGNNADKYEIKDRYRLKIYDVTFEDEGAYECSLGPNDYVGYLTVVDPPSSTDIYWDDGNTWTPMGLPSNLTCYSSKSYPPATFRWYRGSTELTRLATRVTDEGSDGYGRAWSHLEMQTNPDDEGDDIKCMIDTPHRTPYRTHTMVISFSGSNQLTLNFILFFLTITASVCT